MIKGSKGYENFWIIFFFGGDTIFDLNTDGPGTTKFYYIVFCFVIFLFAFTLLARTDFAKSFLNLMIFLTHAASVPKL